MGVDGNQELLGTRFVSIRFLGIRILGNKCFAFVPIYDLLCHWQALDTPNLSIRYVPGVCREEETDWATLHPSNNPSAEITPFIVANPKVVVHASWLAHVEADPERMTKTPVKPLAPLRLPNLHTKRAVTYSPNNHTLQCLAGITGITGAADVAWNITSQQRKQRIGIS